MPRAQEIADLILRIKADSSDIQQDLRGAESRISAFTSTVKKLFAGIGVALLARQLKNAIQGAIDLADQMGKTAQRIGVAVETLSDLSYSAKLADLSFENLQVGLRYLSRNMLDFIQGTGEAKDIIEALGIQVTDAQGRLRSVGDVLLDIADKFAAMPDGVAKTAAAMRLFGRGGVEMITLLNQGSAALREQAEEHRRLGGTIDATTAKAAERFNDNITRIRTGLNALIIALARDLLPALVNVTNAIIEFNKQSGATTGTISSLAYSIQKVAHWAIALAGTIEILGKSLGGLIAADLALFNLRFSEALEHLKSIGEDAGKVIDKTGRAIEKLYAPIPEVRKPAAGLKDDLAKFTILSDKSKDALEKLVSKIAEYRNQLIALTDPARAARMALEQFIAETTKEVKLTADHVKRIEELRRAFAALQAAQEERAGAEVDIQERLSGTSGIIQAATQDMTIAYQEGEISVRDYYEFRRRAAENSTAAEIQALRERMDMEATEAEKRQIAIQITEKEAELRRVIIDLNHEESQSIKDLIDQNLRLAEAVIARQTARLHMEARQRGFTTADAIREEISLQEQLRLKYQEQLDVVDRATDPQRWSDLQDRIVAADAAIIDLNIALKEHTGTMTEGFAAGLAELQDRMASTFQAGKELALDLAQLIQQNFSTLFDDVLTGKLKSFQDYFTAFTRSLVRIFSEAMAKIAARWVLGQLSGGLLAGIIPGAQSGGRIAGGSGIRDDVPIMAQAGEWVLPRPAAQYYGDTIMEALRRMIIPRKWFAVPHFRAGGPVGGGMSVSVGPITIDNNRLAFDLREGIERTVIDILRRHS